jgi:hypothetical protein
MRIRKFGQLWRALPILVCGLLLIMPSPSGAAPPAADLAIRFEALLGQHSVLAADGMRSRIRGDDDFVQAADAALGRNTAAMTALVRQMFGARLAGEFGPMWAEHIVSLFEYASAVAARDEAALAHAREEIEEYELELADFLAAQSRGRLTRSAARTAVIRHVEHLTTQADAYAKQDYATADRLYRLGYQHSYDLGLALAGALLPARDRDTLREPVWRLRSQLGKLLAEHAVLVEDLTRAAAAGTPDFDSSAQMINGNTRDLVAAIDTLFGAAAAAEFDELWGARVENLVAYASGDAQARATVTASSGELAAFLAANTDGRTDAAALRSAFAATDGKLLQHADAYAAKDYPTAYTLAQETYDQMFDLARELADAFGATVAARLPRGGAQTGYGGMAR